MSDLSNDQEKTNANVESVNVEESSDGVKAEVPVEDLILGKFKSIDDLKTAYQNLEKQQGAQSEELGLLRKLKQGLQQVVDKQKEEELEANAKKEYIDNFLPKYDNENYFKNDAFKVLYKAAFDALGTDLDTDGFVEKLEEYVASRLLLQEQLKNAQAENKSVTDSLNFSKGEQKSGEKKLRFQDIPPEELGKYIAKYV